MPFDVVPVGEPAPTVSRGTARRGRPSERAAPGELFSFGCSRSSRRAVRRRSRSTPTRSITTARCVRAAQPEAHAHDLCAVVGHGSSRRCETGPRRHRRVDEARAQRDRADAVAVELGVQRSASARSPPLSSRRRRQARRRRGTRDRGEVDDPAAAHLEQRDRFAGDEQQPAQVHPELQVDVLGDERLDGAADPIPPELTSMSSPPKRSRCSATMRTQSSSRRVGLRRRRAELRSLLPRPSRACATRASSRALFAQHARDREADAGRAAGDDCAAHGCDPKGDRANGANQQGVRRSSPLAAAALRPPLLFPLQSGR